MRSLSILSLRGPSLRSLRSIQIELLHMNSVDWHGYRGRHSEGMMSDSCLPDDIIDYSTVERVIF